VNPSWADMRRSAILTEFPSLVVGESISLNAVDVINTAKVTEKDGWYSACDLGN